MKSRRGKARSTRPLNVKKQFSKVNSKNVHEILEDTCLDQEGKSSTDDHRNNESLADSSPPSNGRKRLSRKDFRAFLKQSRKSRIVLDDKFISTMEDLTDLLDKNCSIDHGIKRIKRFIPILRTAKLMSPQRGRKKKVLKNKAIKKPPNNPSWCPLVLPNDDGLLKLFNIPDNVNEIDPAQLRPSIIVNSEYHSSRAKPLDRFAKLSHHRVNRYLNNIDTLINITLNNSNSHMNTPILLNVSSLNSPPSKGTSIPSSMAHSKFSDSHQSTPEMSNASSSVASETDSLRSKKVRVKSNNNNSEVGKKSVQRELKGLVTWASLVAAEEKGLTTGYVVKNEESLKQTLDLQVSSDNSDTAACRTRRTSLASGNSAHNRANESDAGDDAKSLPHRKTPLSIPSPISEISHNSVQLSKTSPSKGKTTRSRGTALASAALSRKALANSARKTPQSDTFNDPMGHIEETQSVAVGKKNSQLTVNSMTLPPRKRYKTQQHSNGNDTIDVFSEHEDNTTHAESMETYTKSLDEKSNFSDNNPSDNEEEDLSPTKVAENNSKRKRGRPSKGIINHDEPTKISKPGRPKREPKKAAQVGYANIVSGSLNSLKASEIPESDSLSDKAKDGDEDPDEVKENQKSPSTTSKRPSLYSKASMDNQGDDAGKLSQQIPPELEDLNKILVQLKNPVLLRKSHSIFRKHYSNKLKSTKSAEINSSSSITSGSSPDKCPKSSVMNPYSMFRDSSLTSRPMLMKKMDNYVNSPIYPLITDLLNIPVPEDPSYRLFSPVIKLPPYRKYAELHRFFSQCPIPENSPLSIEKLLDLFTIQDVLTTNYQYRVNEIPINTKDLSQILPIIDQCLETMLITWEAFAGRKSWLGRQLVLMRTSYYNLRKSFLTKLSSEGNESAKSMLCASTGNTLSKVGNSLLTTPILFGNTNKKKLEKRQFEKGCEVIKCLCGFRVEGGHLMVQCDLCASWQHLPCLWWAINCKIHPNISQDVVKSKESVIIKNQKVNDKDELTLRCRDALEAAMTIGLAENTAHPKKGSSHVMDSESPYICTNCLKIDDLILDYPQNLAVAMMENDLNLVFQENRTSSISDVQFDYWSLRQVPIGDLIVNIKDIDQSSLQLRTDDYVFIPKLLWNILKDSDFSLKDDIEIFKSKLAGKNLGWESKTLAENIIIRVYRLWKTRDGQGWLEGGAFLRPYHLGHISQDATHKWHSQEVIYDEANKIILPIEYVRGRCVVLSPPSYRVGRPFEISCSDHDFADQINPFVYICEKIITKSENSPDQIILDEIEPGYLKVLQKSYCFLKHSENSSLRTGIVHDKTSTEILSKDKEIELVFYSIMPRLDEEDQDDTNLKLDTQESSAISDETKPFKVKINKMSLSHILQRLKLKPKLPKRLKSSTGSLNILRKPRKSNTVTKRPTTVNDLTQDEKISQVIETNGKSNNASKKHPLPEAEETREFERTRKKYAKKQSLDKLNKETPDQVSSKLYPVEEMEQVLETGRRSSENSSTSPHNKPDINVDMNKTQDIEDVQVVEKSQTSTKNSKKSIPSTKNNLQQEPSEVAAVVAPVSDLPVQIEEAIPESSQRSYKNSINQTLEEIHHLEETSKASVTINLLESNMDDNKTVKSPRKASINSPESQVANESVSEKITRSRKNSAVSNHPDQQVEDKSELVIESLNKQALLDKANEKVPKELEKAPEDTSSESTSGSRRKRMKSAKPKKILLIEEEEKTSDQSSVQLHEHLPINQLNLEIDQSSHLSIEVNAIAQIQLIDQQINQVVIESFTVEKCSNRFEIFESSEYQSFAEVSTSHIDIKTCSLPLVEEEEKDQVFVKETSLKPSEPPSQDIIDPNNPNTVSILETTNQVSGESIVPDNTIPDKDSNDSTESLKDNISAEVENGSNLLEENDSEKKESVISEKSSIVQEAPNESNVLSEDRDVDRIFSDDNEILVSIKSPLSPHQKTTEIASSSPPESNDNASEIIVQVTTPDKEISNLPTEDNKTETYNNSLSSPTEKDSSPLPVPVNEENLSTASVNALEQIASSSPIELSKNTDSESKSCDSKKAERLHISPIPELNFSDPFEEASPKPMEKSHNDSLDIADSPEAFQLVSYSDEEEHTSPPINREGEKLPGEEESCTNFLISDDV